MKFNLLYKENSPDSRPELCVAADSLKSDLELGRILDTMSGGDKVIYDACEDALLRPLQTAEAITYRHAALADAERDPGTVRRLYAITAEADKIPKFYPTVSRMLETYASAVSHLDVYIRLLRDVRDAADKKAGDFRSEGFRSLFEMLRRELTDSFFRDVQDRIEEMNNLDSTLIGAKLGGNLMSVDYTMRRKEKGFWLRWHMSPSFTVDAEKNPQWLDDLGRRRERAILEAANVLVQSAKYLEDFLVMLRGELAFYVGCLNLSDKIRSFGMTLCTPVLLPPDGTERSWRGLYDVSLVLTKGSAAVGNDLEVSGKRLFIITGANQGGKSTFLRSFGQAQLMAQCGMPVGAESFAAPLRRRVFTHFDKEEDSFMKSGRLDEELGRMDRLADVLESGSLVLFNESFASTNEREGSEILRQITKALVENGIEVFSVTHMYTYAAAFLGDEKTMFLRAERREDTARTFKIKPGEPLETAYGEDLYRKIFSQGA